VCVGEGWCVVMERRWCDRDGMGERVVLRYIKTVDEGGGDWCEVYREGK
jgi:hypothetical protein